MKFQVQAIKKKKKKKRQKGTYYSFLKPAPREPLKMWNWLSNSKQYPTEQQLPEKYDAHSETKVANHKRNGIQATISFLYCVVKIFGPLVLVKSLIIRLLKNFFINLRKGRQQMKWLCKYMI